MTDQDRIKELEAVIERAREELLDSLRFALAKSWRSYDAPLTPGASSSIILFRWNPTKTPTRTPENV